MGKQGEGLARGSPRRQGVPSPTCSLLAVNRPGAAHYPPAGYCSASGNRLLLAASTWWLSCPLGDWGPGDLGTECPAWRG